MSCGCAKGQSNPENIIEDKAESDETARHPVPMLANETVECYAQRVGPTDPATQEPPPENKIETLNIPVDCEMKVNVPFKMTPQSQLPVTWELEIKDDKGEVVTPDQIGLQFDSNSGVLQGTIKKEYEKKTFSASMKAKKESEIVDEKAYKFVGKKCEPGELKFIHPNPSGRLTSKFGPRTPPTPSSSDFHKGVDFSTRGKADILASADGIVSFAGVQRGFGNIIIIDHKDPSGKLLASTKYAHLDRMYVSSGQQVAAGTPIGHEGNTGIGTGPHLHFEILLAGKGNVDPMQYINGTIQVDPSSETGSDPGNPSDQPASVVENKNKALTKEEVDAKSECTPLENNELANKADPPTAANSKPIVAYQAKTSICRPPGEEGKPSKEKMLADINETLAKHPELDEEQKKYIRNTAAIESSYDPYAKAGSTSALGPFQMVNATAGDLYSKIGVEPTCENRCDTKIATEAQIVKVKEDSRIYDKYKNTGKILGRTPPANAHTSEYNNMSKGEFLYMIHHDGAGSVQRGNNLGGVKYYRDRARNAV